MKFGQVVIIALLTSRPFNRMDGHHENKSTHNSISHVGGQQKWCHSFFFLSIFRPDCPHRAHPQVLGSEFFLTLCPDRSAPGWDNMSGCLFSSFAKELDLFLHNGSILYQLQFASYLASCSSTWMASEAHWVCVCVFLQSGHKIYLCQRSKN